MGSQQDFLCDVEALAKDAAAAENRSRSVASTPPSERPAEARTVSAASAATTTGGEGTNPDAEDSASAGLATVTVILAR
jgi:hypothetical protein